MHSSSPALASFFLQHKLSPAERHGQGLDECKLSKDKMRLDQDHCGQWKERLVLLAEMEIFVHHHTAAMTSVWWLFSLMPPWWDVFLWCLWTTGGSWGKGWDDHSSLPGRAAVPCSCIWKADCVCLQFSCVSVSFGRSPYVEEFGPISPLCC